MRSSKVIGMICVDKDVNFTNVTIRAEKTEKLTTLSLADDKRGIMLEVDYKEIKKLVKEVEADYKEVEKLVKRF